MFQMSGIHEYTAPLHSEENGEGEKKRRAQKITASELHVRFQILKDITCIIKSCLERLYRRTLKMHCLNIIIIGTTTVWTDDEHFGQEYNHHVWEKLKRKKNPSHNPSKLGWWIIDATQVCVLQLLVH